MAKIAQNDSKKGIFFTFIAITMMTIFILIFSPQVDLSLQKDTQALNARITTIDNYINDLEDNYLKIVAKATASRAISSLVFYMNSTGSYLSDFDAAFQEVFVNGTINNAPIDSITNKKIMDNRTFSNWSSMMAQSAHDVLKVNTTIIVLSASAAQTGPWDIDIELKINLSVKSNVAEWDKISIITASLPIDGLHDPYYLVNTKSTSSYTNLIKRSGVEFNQWDIAKAREHLRNGTYVHWQGSDAPSFLMRFTNTITPSSCCGIESLVNPKLVRPGDQTESYVDYLFWSHRFNDCAQLYNINGLWGEFSFFKLEFDHVVKYNLQDTATKTCQ